MATASRFKQKVEFMPQQLLERLRSITRLKAMEESNDGFRLSEIDLKMRGPGDIFGKKQSGIPDFKYCDIANDSAIMFKAKEEAQLIINKDPDFRLPEYSVIGTTLERELQIRENYYGVG
jgi:ATP-dependent DNA helicase RecG